MAFDGEVVGAADRVVGAGVGVVVLVQADTMIMPAMRTSARLKSANGLGTILHTACKSLR
jgi:hypothetical protein